jgi:hypothetical protein
LQLRQEDFGVHHAEAETYKAAVLLSNMCISESSHENLENTSRAGATQSVISVKMCHMRLYTHARAHSECAHLGGVLGGIPGSREVLGRM